MCFRPASLSKPIECPNCKKKISAMAGIKQKKCPFCGAELPANDAKVPPQKDKKDK